jgi:hypothetical protein
VNAQKTGDMIKKQAHGFLRDGGFVTGSTEGGWHFKQKRHLSAVMG